MKPILEVDNVNSWSEDIRNKIQSIVSAENEKENKWRKFSKFERLCQVEQEKVDYQPISKMITELEELLKNYDVACYHYTRLTVDDVKSIKTEGLSVLCPSDHRRRLMRIAKLLNLDPSIIKRIQRFDYNIGRGVRIGNLHFVYSIFIEDCGCNTFLENYGGEITYHMFGDCPEQMICFNEISRPYIIKFKLSYEEIRCSFITENMISIAKNDGVVTSNNCGEGFIIADVPANQIIELIPADYVLQTSLNSGR